MVTNYQLPKTKSYYQKYNQNHENDLYIKYSNKVKQGYIWLSTKTCLLLFVTL